MKKTEIVFVTLSLIALGLNLLLIPGGGVLTVLALSTLSLIYCYFSFALFNDIKLRDIFKKGSYQNLSRLRIVGAVGTGFALSLTTIGLMFKFQSWPGADFNLGGGLVGLFIVSVIGIVKYSKNRLDYYARILKRVALFGGLGLIVMIIPKTSWIGLKYRNQPEYVDALKKALADPDNEGLWDEVEKERQRIHDHDMH